MNRHRIVLAPTLLAAVLASLGALAEPAGATKEYARKEEKDCSHCHISDKGSGPRNGVGRQYEANGYRFGVKSWSNDANRDQYLRANSAYLATWYFEALRNLDAVEKSETLPGGLALAGGRKARMKMFPKAWLRAAKGILAKKKASKRHRESALRKFLVRLESQFPASEQGKEATRILDELAGDPALASEVKDARAREKVRVIFLQAKTELGLGNRDKGRKLLESVKDDALLEQRLREEAAKLLTDTPE